VFMSVESGALKSLFFSPRISSFVSVLFPFFPLSPRVLPSDLAKTFFFSSIVGFSGVHGPPALSDLPRFFFSPGGQMSDQTRVFCW